jgi:hypothetical protein
MQDVQVLKTKEIQELREALTRLASTHTVTFAEEGVIHTESDKENDRVFEEFRFCKLSVCRIKYIKLDYKAKRPYATSALAKRIKQRMDAQVAPGPSLGVTQWFMARILQSNNGKVDGKAEMKWSRLHTAAQARLWLKRDLREDDIAEMMKGSSDGKFLAYLAQVKKNLKRLSKDDFQQFDWLKEAVADESM